MALRGFVKCLADGHHCANIMLAAVNRSVGNARKKLLRLAFLRRFIAANNVISAIGPFVIG